jgi:protein-L-isoaspartate(D-aspartate) O-methyltransferase
MCELLTLQGEERVLDVGTGSGYAAAVLAELGREVVSIERIPELAAQARENLAIAGYERVEVRVGDGSLGAPDRTPFEAIAVAAATPELPPVLYEQLAPRGRIVLPRGSRHSQRLVVIEKTAHGPVERGSVRCRFVPLLGQGGFAPDR